MQAQKERGRLQQRQAALRPSAIAATAITTALTTALTATAKPAASFSAAFLRGLGLVPARLDRE